MSGHSIVAGHILRAYSWFTATWGPCSCCCLAAAAAASAAAAAAAAETMLSGCSSHHAWARSEGICPLTTNHTDLTPSVNTSEVVWLPLQQPVAARASAAAMSFNNYGAASAW
jgi:hypothetical protein